MGIITKKTSFVILLVFALSFLVSCTYVGLGSGQKREPSKYFGDPTVTGNIRSRLVRESSGLATTACHPNVFWTLNDSGNENEIYAFSRTGRLLSRWLVSGSRNVDWEAMASFRDKKGNCFLYIADIGNNEKKRSKLTIYRIQEPDPKGRSQRTEQAKVINFSYPDGKYNAEAFMVHPSTGEMFVVTKTESGKASVYLVEAKKTRKYSEVDLPSFPNGMVTGGSISSDGKRIVLSDYLAAYEFRLNPGESFEGIFSKSPDVIELGTRQQGEAITYTSDGNAVIATSERLNSPIIFVEREK